MRKVRQSAREMRGGEEGIPQLGSQEAEVGAGTHG